MTTLLCLFHLTFWKWFFILSGIGAWIFIILIIVSSWAMNSDEKFRRNLSETKLS